VDKTAALGRRAWRDHTPGMWGAVGPDSRTIVAVSALHKSFDGVAALDGVDLRIDEGTLIGLIGPSGCGKTTLIRTLTGVVSPDTGAVRVLGRDPGQFTGDDRRRFGYQPQKPVLFPNLSLWGNLTFVASMYGVPLRNRGRRLRQLLDLVDLRASRRTLFSHASGGMQRRLALAATLVHDPQLVFLDEPTAGVDPILRGRLWDHFRRLRDEGRTVLTCTQYVAEAALCDLVAVMVDGRIITVDTPDGLRRRATAIHPAADPDDFDEVFIRLVQQHRTLTASRAS
jgi:ABC-2 type transport system ATP-binding protein